MTTTPTLTDLQYITVRADIGDNVEPFDIADQTLAALYADADYANGNLNLLHVYALRMRRGLAINTAIDDSGNITGINARNSQKLTNIDAALAYWESVCGLSAGQSVAVTNPRPQRSDQQKTDVFFRWQADALAARLMTNDPSALQDLENNSCSVESK